MTPVTHAVRELSEQDIMMVSGGDLTDIGTVAGYTVEDGAEVAGTTINTVQTTLSGASNVLGSTSVLLKDFARNAAFLIS